MNVGRRERAPGRPLGLMRARALAIVCTHVVFRVGGACPRIGDGLARHQRCPCLRTASGRLWDNGLSNLPWSGLGASLCAGCSGP